MTNFTPEKCKQIALARLDVVHKWLEFRKKSQNKLQADYDFVKLHNTSNSHLFEILGKISRGSLHRWLAMLNGTEDYTKLLPQYKYSTAQVNCTRKSGQWKFKLFNRKKEVQKMAKRQIQFTQEQIEILLKNPNVADATTNTIKFTPEFKKLALQKTEEGMSPNDIFKEAGFDLKIIGKKTPNNRIRAWKFYERHSNKNNTKYLAKEIKKNKILKNILEENRYLKAENEFLKKLQALSVLTE